MTIILIIVIYFDGIKTSYNSTIGWAWDIRLWMLVAEPMIWLLFLIGYGLLALFKINTNYLLSLLQIIAILLVFILDDILYIKSLWIPLLMILSIPLLVFNIVKSIKAR